MHCFPGDALLQGSKLCSSLADEPLPGLGMNAAGRCRRLWSWKGGFVLERRAFHCQSLQTGFACRTACKSQTILNVVFFLRLSQSMKTAQLSEQPSYTGRYGLNSVPSSDEIHPKSCGRRKPVTARVKRPHQTLRLEGLHQIVCSLKAGSSVPSRGLSALLSRPQPLLWRWALTLPA